MPSLQSTLEDGVLVASAVLGSWAGVENDVEVDNELKSDLLKLLGSSFLLCGSLCHALGAKALPQLSVTLLSLHLCIFWIFLWRVFD